MSETKNEFVRQVAEQKYEFGFTTDVHTEIIPVGLNEDVVRLISQKKGEPEWMLDFRLKAFRYWKEQTEPKWGHVHVPSIDYQAISYYADPLSRKEEGGKRKEICIAKRSNATLRHQSNLFPRSSFLIPRKYNYFLIPATQTEPMRKLTPATIIIVD